MAVAHDDILYAPELKELHDGGSGSSWSVYDHAYAFFLFACDFETVYETGKSDNSRSMLIIMHDRDIELCLESIFDLKTSWGREIFEINPSKCESDVFDGLYNLFGILCREYDRKRIDSSKFLKEYTLSLHDRESCQRSDISQSEDGRSIRDHRNGIGFESIEIGIFWIFFYR